MESNVSLVTQARRGRAGEPDRTGALEQLVRRIGRHGRRSGDTVHLYLDVSGSLESLLGKLHAAVRDVVHLVGRDVHLFSTSLQDVSVGNLSTGACRTTGGTSIVPVASHIRENGVRRAVIVTDGQVGVIGPGDRETLARTILGVALTSEREADGDLARIARLVVVLPGL